MVTSFLLDVEKQAVVCAGAEVVAFDPEQRHLWHRFIAPLASTVNVHSRPAFSMRQAHSFRSKNALFL